MSFCQLAAGALGVLLIGMTSAQAETFGGRVEFAATRMLGRIQVYCSERGRRDWAVADCQDWTLEPFEAAYFRGRKDLPATHVEVRSEWADGTIRTRKDKYQAAEGRSQNRMNLWIETLLQRALLDLGENQISYKYIQQDKVLGSGRFMVTVSRGPDRFCRQGSYQSRNLSDCRSPHRLCPDYFRRENLCR